MFSSYSSDMFFLNIASVLFASLLAYRILPGIIMPSRLSHAGRVSSFIAFFMTPPLLSYMMTESRLYLTPVIWCLSYLLTIPSSDIRFSLRMNYDTGIFATLFTAFVAVSVSHSVIGSVIVWALASSATGAFIFLSDRKTYKTLDAIPALAWGVFSSVVSLPVIYVMDFRKRV